MPLTPQTQRLHPDNELVRRKRVHSHAQIPQDLHPHPHRERNATKCIPELQAMIPFARIVHLREPLRVLAPIELATVHDHAPNRGAVPANPLGGRVHHNIRPVVDRPAEIPARSERVVDHDRHACLMRDRDNGLEVRDVVTRVADALDIDRLRPVIDQALELVGFVPLDEFRRDAQSGEGDFELVVGAPVQVARADDVVTGMRQRGDDHELRSLARGRPDGGSTSFERGDALFQHVDGGVHDAGVDVAELLEPEQAGAVIGVVEHIARGGVDGHGASIGGRVGGLPVVFMGLSIRTVQWGRYAGEMQGKYAPSVQLQRFELLGGCVGCHDCQLKGFSKVEMRSRIRDHYANRPEIHTLYNPAFFMRVLPLCGRLRGGSSPAHHPPARTAKC